MSHRFDFLTNVCTICRETKLAVVCRQNATDDPVEMARRWGSWLLNLFRYRKQNDERPEKVVADQKELWCVFLQAWENDT